jgi:muramoyltetrapeptide carboxypeptidase
MKIIKPPRLRRGDVIGICAPASPPESREKLEKGIRYLERLGYGVELGANAYRKNGYLAGTDEQRAADINNFFADKKIKAIFTIRGGYGSQRILPLLNYSLIKRNPKILVGYSDITALHCALFAHCGLVTFSGPMVAAEMSGNFHGKTEERFWRDVTSTKPPTPLVGKRTFPALSHRKTVSTGRLMGGNLSLLSSLVGSAHFPRQNDIIYLIEEIDERPYRIDRMLQQLHSAKIFQAAAGIALGDFRTCIPAKGKSSLSIQEIFLNTFCQYNFPIVSGFSYGHIRNSLSFPIGVRVIIDQKRNSVTFLESGVTE